MLTLSKQDGAKTMKLNDAKQREQKGKEEKIKYYGIIL